MSEDKLTRDDLIILMESYRNMITMHQTILDQTSKMIGKLDNIATKQDSFFSAQGQICNLLSNISEDVNNFSSKIEKITEKQNEHETKTLEQNNKLTTKIHMGWIGMGTIVISLIGLAITFMNIIDKTPMP